MPRLWIIHREERARSAWIELLGEPLASGHPGDLRTFAEAETPEVVVLGLAGDLEAELEFAHRHAARLVGTGWLVLSAPAGLPEAQRLFDALPAEFAPDTAGGSVLRRHVEALAARRPAPTLSERGRRDRLRERFVRWFADLDLPDALGATDPKRVEVPLRVRGEPGIGRGLLARYVHWVGSGPPPGPFVALPCVGIGRIEELAQRAVVETGRLPGGHHVTLCLEGVEQLRPELQRALLGWIEHGPPAGLARAPRLRWMALSDERFDGDLDPDLERALAGFSCRLPPLTQREGAVADFVAATARAWCAARGERERVFAPDAVEVLRSRPWPGNLRQLEAVLLRTLAVSGSTQIPALELRLDPVRAPARPSEPTPATGPAETGAASLRRLAAAVAREAGAPLGGIRTLTRMLPRRHHDPDYREQLMARVDADAARIQSVLDALARLAALPPPSPTRVDVSALLSGLLELRRAEIDERGLVVLEELDREHPFALADRDQLRLAFETLIQAALDWLSDSGELALTTHHQVTPGGAGSLRVRIRVRQPAGDPGPQTEGSLATSVAEMVVLAQAGHFRQGPDVDGETSIAIDLPAEP